MKPVQLCKSLLIISLFLFTLGCSGGTKNKIVGKWQPSDKSEKGISFEFIKDGSAVITSGEDSSGGKWSILDDGRLKIEFSQLGNTTIILWKVSFNGNDEASVSDGENKPEKMIRVKL